MVTITAKAWHMFEGHGGGGQAVNMASTLKTVADYNSLHLIKNSQSCRGETILSSLTSREMLQGKKNPKMFNLKLGKKVSLSLNWRDSFLRHRRDWIPIFSQSRRMEQKLIA